MKNPPNRVLNIVLSALAVAGVLSTLSGCKWQARVMNDEPRAVVVQQVATAADGLSVER